MKTITCAQMGGLCETKISGQTQDEMLANGMQHLEAAHPEMAETVKTMPADDPMMVAWSKKFHETWDSTPEDAA